MADIKGLTPRGFGHQLRALVWSYQGFKTAFQTESSFRTESYLTVILGPLAFVLGRTPVECALLFGTLLLLLLTELLNSAIEKVVDQISPDYAEFAGHAKDMGSAAVLMAIINLIVVWVAVLWSRFAT
jgi:diacylglycerol kinase (ATP)